MTCIYLCSELDLWQILAWEYLIQGPGKKSFNPWCIVYDRNLGSDITKCFYKSKKENLKSYAKDNNQSFHPHHLFFHSPHHEWKKLYRVNPAYNKLNYVPKVSENTFNFSLPSTSASATSTLFDSRSFKIFNFPQAGQNGGRPYWGNPGQVYPAVWIQWTSSMLIQVIHLLNWFWCIRIVRQGRWCVVPSSVSWKQCDEHFPV